MYLLGLTSGGEVAYASYLPPVEQGILVAPSTEGQVRIVNSRSVHVFDLRVEPPPSIGCVANGASLHPQDALAPGQIVTLFGRNLGPVEGVEADWVSGQLPRERAGVRLLFDGVPAPLLRVREDRIDAAVPLAMRGRASAQVTVERDGQAIATTPVALASTGFALFTAHPSGRGQVIAQNEDGTWNGPDRPARLGSVVTLYGTGLGVTNIGLGLPALTRTEDMLTGDELLLPPFRVEPRVWDQPTALLDVRTAPGWPTGVVRIRLRLPDAVPLGNDPSAAWVAIDLGDEPSHLSDTFLHVAPR